MPSVFLSATQQWLWTWVGTWLDLELRREVAYILRFWVQIMFRIELQSDWSIRSSTCLTNHYKHPSNHESLSHLPWWIMIQPACGQSLLGSSLNSFNEVEQMASSMEGTSDEKIPLLAEEGKAQETQETKPDEEAWWNMELPHDFFDLARSSMK